MTRDFDEIVLRLKNKDLQVRRDAADVLGKLEDTRAVEPLIAALKDGDERVRGAVARALGWIGDARAADHRAMG